MKVSPAPEQEEAQEAGAGAEETKGSEAKQDSSPGVEVKSASEPAGAEEDGGAEGAAKTHAEDVEDDGAMRFGGAEAR